MQVQLKPRHRRLSAQGPSCVIALLANVVPIPVLANVVWPALYLEMRLLTWWVVLVGLLIEVVFVAELFELTWRRAAMATVMANLASTVAGIPLIPLAGIGWEFLPALLYNSAFGWGTFNPVTYGATFVLASLINASVESLVYRRGFKLALRRREFGWLLFANGLSVAVAGLSLLMGTG